jgi:adenosylcobinamide-phosphate synthase
MNPAYFLCSVLLIVISASVLDYLIGDPQSWPHPVRWIGRLISLLEKLIRRITPEGSKEGFLLGGFFLYLITVALSGAVVYFMLRLSYRYLIYLWIPLCLYLVYASICLRDLVNHTQRVESFLGKNDLEGARGALSYIVGRDTKSLDINGIRRAEIETLAENFSDGLIAPLFYLALGGPVLAWVYKASNTLDSMVGYKNDKYLYLGRVSARMDDALNFIPSRLAALFLILAAKLKGKNAKDAFLLWRKEGRLHTSPNSGQTEAAMAGALGVFLGGSSNYGGQSIEKPTLNAGGKEADREAVRDAESIVAMGTLLFLILAIGLIALSFLILGSPLGWGIEAAAPDIGSLATT